MHAQITISFRGGIAWKGLIGVDHFLETLYVSTTRGIVRVANDTSSKVRDIVLIDCLYRSRLLITKLVSFHTVHSFAN